MITRESLLNARPAVLVLHDGKIFHGTGFGATKRVYGECVFTTFPGAGYPEALTDPSNWGQICVLAYPLIGNYGVPPWQKDEFGITKWFESESIKSTGFVVHEACKQPSHYESTRTLDQFLLEGGVPGIEGIDTRYLTQIIRTEGIQMGMLEVFDSGNEIPSDDELRGLEKKAKDPNLRHLVAEVSRKTPDIFSPAKPIATVVAIDCGIKNNIIRNLIRRRIKVVVVPYNYTYEQIMAYNPKGVLISNGPGDPKLCVEAIAVGKQLIAENFPTLGVCLGNQILGLAAGGDTFKLKYGHRGANKPVIDERTGRAYITSQNHGYALDTESIANSGFKLLFRNLDDNSCEGIYHPQKPILSSQFHPEAFPGPEDTNWIFDVFMEKMGLKT